MKRLIHIVILFAAFVTIGATPSSGQNQWTITDESRMWVDGTSTIHGWTCEVGQVEGTIMGEAAAGTISGAEVSVPANSIDCDNGTMNKKAAQALDVKSHPTIRYTLSSADVTKQDDQLNVQATGTLDLAGTSKEVTANLVGQSTDDGGMQFTGTLPLKMSEFGIDPPTAMLGALRTGNDITIRFEIVASPSDIGTLSSTN